MLHQSSTVAAVLFKAPRDERKQYQQELGKQVNGCTLDTVAYVPVLQYHKRPWETLFEDVFSCPEKFGSVIVTSPRAADVAKDAMQRLMHVESQLSSDNSGCKITKPSEAAKLSSVDDDRAVQMENRNHHSHAWLCKRVYVVGNATAEIMRDAGFRDVVGSESGNAKGLADLIISERNSLFHCDVGHGMDVCTETQPSTTLQTSNAGSRLPLLFLCGAVRRPTLTNALKSANILVHIAVVYDAKPSCPNQLPKKLLQLFSLRDAKSIQPRSNKLSPTNDVQTLILGYFSPRGARLTFQSLIPETLQKLDDAWTGREWKPSVLFLAIGASTFEALIGLLDEQSTEKSSGCRSLSQGPPALFEEKTIQSVIKKTSDSSIVYLPDAESNRLNFDKELPAHVANTFVKIVRTGKQSESKCWQLPKSGIKLYLCKSAKPTARAFAEAAKSYCIFLQRKP